jgi:hypothetical protein
MSFRSIDKALKVRQNGMVPAYTFLVMTKLVPDHSERGQKGVKCYLLRETNLSPAQDRYIYPLSFFFPMWPAHEARGR